MNSKGYQLSDHADYALRVTMAINMQIYSEISVMTPIDFSNILNKLSITQG